MILSERREWQTTRGPGRHRDVNDLPMIFTRDFDFHEWRSQEWKSLANGITSDPKIVIQSLSLTVVVIDVDFKPKATPMNEQTSIAKGFCSVRVVPHFFAPIY